jgi:chemotaxis protein MotA
MSYLLGIVIGAISILAALQFLDQTILQYFDDVAIAVVMGGTLSVAIIILPWEHWREIWRACVGVFFTRSADDKRLIEDTMAFVSAANSGEQRPVETRGLPGVIMAEGRELIDLRFEPSEIESILMERVHQATERTKKVANSIRSLAKYPPAFGLVGTVFGLVNLMRAITDGLDPRETGVRMAIALVATLYGLVLANLFIAPLGERISKNAETMKKRSEIAVQAVLLAAGGVSLLKAQEMLNSYVSSGRRVNFIKSSMDREVDVA